MQARNLILNKKQTLQKIKRIAYEIYERNYEETEIVLAGIYDRGYFFAQKLCDVLVQISPLQIRLVKISMDKFTSSQCEILLDTSVEDLKSKVIILTDDVLNTGRTLAYALKPFLNIPVKKLQVAVIINRHNFSFPIAADYVGYSLATTLKEHIEVDFDESQFGVYIR
ncbi:MAG: phosphoribosyltransferase family protein [Cytophagaceae bacterium]|nr:phosphoribosyltransferase family protein [Cytophagaceae bacterium]MDW8455217.1 phosphoribosyltransferase family protein [Cytophagaceae bacterium]